MLTGDTSPSTTVGVVRESAEGLRRSSPRIAGTTDSVRLARSPLSLKLERPGDHRGRRPAHVLADAETSRPVTARTPAVDGLLRDAEIVGNLVDRPQLA